jgi:hypothetical protein
VSTSRRKKTDGHAVIVRMFHRFFPNKAKRAGAVPVVVASKSRVPVIEYDEKSAAALAACRAYLAEAQEFLEGRRGELPNARDLIDARFPLSTIREARCDGADLYELGWPFVAAIIDDPMATRERYFDPWYFAAMRLLEVPGGRFIFGRSNRSKSLSYRFYLAYVGSRTKEGLHYVTRIIFNPSPRSDVRQMRDHHDYRRVTLQAIPKKEVWDELGQETRGRSRLREDAIRSAIKLFERQLNDKNKVPVLNLSRHEYDQLLHRAFNVADRMHEKWLTERRAEHGADQAAAE